MKKTCKIITLIFVSGILFVLLLGLWLGTQNIYLGSADYTKTVFDFDKSDTVWEWVQMGTCLILHIID